MNMVEKIRTSFANLSAGHTVPLEDPDGEFPSWAIKFRDSYAVAIEIDNEEIKINESFSNVNYYTDYYNIDNQKKYLLILSSNELKLRNEFAGVCAVFLEKGEGNSKRINIKKNPLDWWLKWKELIGNKSVDSTVHGVLGELLALYWFKKCIDSSLKTENWTGPDGKSIDITTKTKKAEVKTTLIKYNNIVTISGQFQLDHESDMSLIFIKLEELGGSIKDKNIVSIDKMLNLLSDLGMDKFELNKKVERMGLKENSMDRKRKYRVLEMIEYPINEKFPIINLDSLKDGIDKDRILQLTYKIELSGLDNKMINISIP